MLVSPFTFYRGAAAIMAADLAPTPVSGITAQLCGDAHLSNFGVFGTPERQLIFDINDFDETLPGPWERDIKRMAASFEVMDASAAFLPTTGMRLSPPGCGSTGSRCAGPPECRRWACGMTSWKPGCCSTWSGSRSASGSWTRSQRGGRKSMWPRPMPTTAPGCSPNGAAEVEGELRIAADPPVIVPIEDLIVPGVQWEDPGPLIKKLLASYRRTLGHQGHPLEEFRYVHAARKVVGVGSVGTRRYILLLTGRDEDDPLFLQVKEAQPSALEPYAGRSTYPHHGQRVVMGQRLMQKPPTSS